MDDFVRWNDRVVSAKSLSITIAGVPYSGITALSYSEKMDKAIVHGANHDGVPLGMTSGKYEVDDVSITMLKDVFNVKFKPQMAALSIASPSPAPGSWGGASFPIGVQYIELPLPPSTDLISGCQITAAKDTYQEGIEAALIELTMKAMTISRDGLVLFNRLRGLL